MAKTCWECKHHTVKLTVQVPPNHTIKEYIHCTGDFCTDIVAIAKDAQAKGQYTVWFRHKEALKPITFRMIHTCKLTQNQNGTVCIKHEQKIDHNHISNVTYSRMLTTEAPAVIRRRKKHRPKL